METWVGYYVEDEVKFEMRLDFVDINSNTGEFRASGADICGNFTYNGNILATNFTAVKDYSSWVIHYSGRYFAEKNEISGFWGFEPQERVSPFLLVKIPSGKIEQFRSNLVNGVDPLSNI